MIILSLIYAAITFLLAIVDTIRIKVKWGKVANINHKVSDELAIYSGGLLLAVWVGVNCPVGEWHWIYLINFVLFIVAFISIRFLFYDITLNFLRILTKTNPTMRLDYMSTTTNDYEDNHTMHITFWDKRILAIAGWIIVYIVYHLIFKTW